MTSASLAVPARLLEVHQGDEEGRAWLDSLPSRVERAIERWHLEVGAPFEDGMAAWTAPATTSTGDDVVLKVSIPCPETRYEAAGLAVWQGLGAVELVGANTGDSALLLRRLRPGTTLRDAHLPSTEHLSIGADLLRRLGTASVPADHPFEDLVDVATRLGGTAAERFDRLLPNAPIPVDPGLCRQGIDLLNTLARDAPRSGLIHGDFNPGNILRHDDDRRGGWVAIDPEPIHGDLAWDPWPLVTQVGDTWTTVVATTDDLAARARLVGDRAGLDPGRCAAWCVARGVEHGLWAADRGWWTGFLGADGDFDRTAAWAKAMTLFGD